MKLGKPSRQIMAETVFRRLGARSPKIVKGPRTGLDVSVLAIGPDQVMVLSTDPLSLIPQLGVERSAWLSVHGIASDVATSGVAPKFAMFDLNLPPSMSDSQLKSYWTSIHKTCRELGIAILGGHTGRFHGCDYTVVGSGTFFGMAKREAYVTSDMAKDGDDLIMTKSAAIEATSVLSLSFPRTVEKSLGRQLLKNARKLFRSISVVKDSLIAASVGLKSQGVSAMHDATEGGVLAAALEMADASGLKAAIQLEAIPVSEEAKNVCGLFRIDPLYALGQGSLLMSVRREQSARIINALEEKGISTNIVGTLAKGKSHTYFGPDNVTRELTYPREDPYWKAFWSAVRKGYT